MRPELVQAVVVIARRTTRASKPTTHRAATSLCDPWIATVDPSTTMLPCSRMVQRAAKVVLVLRRLALLVPRPVLLLHATRAEEEAINAIRDSRRRRNLGANRDSSTTTTTAPQHATPRSHLYPCHRPCPLPMHSTTTRQGGSRTVELVCPASRLIHRVTTTTTLRGTRQRVAVSPPRNGTPTKWGSRTCRRRTAWEAAKASSVTRTRAMTVPVPAFTTSNSIRLDPSFQGLAHLITLRFFLYYSFSLSLSFVAVVFFFIVLPLFCSEVSYTTLAFSLSNKRTLFAI